MVDSLLLFLHIHDLIWQRDVHLRWCHMTLFTNPRQQLVTLDFNFTNQTGARWSHDPTSTVSKLTQKQSD